MQPLFTAGGLAVTIGWLIALLILILGIVFLVIGIPDPKTILLLIIGLAVARLL